MILKIGNSIVAVRMTAIVTVRLTATTTVRITDTTTVRIKATTTICPRGFLQNKISNFASKMQNFAS